MGDINECHGSTSCHDCGNITGCHWCGDASTGKCYSDSESFTCLWSTPCSELEKCLRQEAEFIGYGSNYSYIVNGFIAICVVLMLSLCCTIVCSAFVQVTSSVSYADDNRYYELREIDENEGNSDEDEDEGNSHENDIVVLPENANEAQVLQSYDDGWRYIPKIAQLNTPRKVKHCQRFAHISCAVFTFAVIVTVLTLIFTSPHFPEFTVCASEVDWSSMLKTFKNPTGSIQGKYILQASVYNPNKFDISMVNCTGTFKYKSTVIGRFTIDNTHKVNGKQKEFIVPAGSVGDILFVADLDVGISSAAYMYADYFYYNDLMLKVKTETYVGVMAGSSDEISYHTFYSLPEETIELSGFDDSICKCKLNN